MTAQLAMGMIVYFGILGTWKSLEFVLPTLFIKPCMSLLILISVIFVSNGYIRSNVVGDNDKSVIARSPDTPSGVPSRVQPDPPLSTPPSAPSSDSSPVFNKLNPVRAISDEPLSKNRTSGSVIGIIGSIHLIMGPMFSGKTRELQRRVDVRRIAAQRKSRSCTSCLLIKYKKDQRYDNQAVVSHNLSKDYNCMGVDELKEADIVIQTQSISHIFIDEGQFFPDLHHFCLKWSKEENRQVTVAALDAYATQELWPQVAKLLPWCIEVNKLNAVCGQCGADAPLSIRRVVPTDHSKSDHSKPTTTTSETKIGGKELYDACCLHCHHRL